MSKVNFSKLKYMKTQARDDVTKPAWSFRRSTISDELILVEVDSNSEIADAGVPRVGDERVRRPHRLDAGPCGSIRL